jgi:hypothetical protein
MTIAPTDYLSPLRFPELKMFVSFYVWRSLVFPWWTPNRFRDEFVEQVRHRLVFAGVNAAEIVDCLRRAEDMFEQKLASVASDTVRAGVDLVTFLQLRAKSEIGAQMALEVTTVEVTANEEAEHPRYSRLLKS